MKTEIIPVIHMVNEEQVLMNVDTCLECGIEKVFIINHGISVERLILCADRVRKEYESLWVGLNLLGMKNDLALSMQMPINGLWIDSSVTFFEASKRKFKGMLFGGLAFKYQPQPIDLKQACEEAKLTTDVATTSGAGTGKPANTEKIKSIREYLGEHPMAIASGVSLGNVINYKGIANYLLVATSITDVKEMIIKEDLLRLNEKCKE